MAPLLARLVPLARRMPPLVPAAAWRLLRLLSTPPGVARYLRDRRSYLRLAGREEVRWRNAYPVLAEAVPTTPYDAHYFFQDAWAANRIAERRPDRHVDVGSRVDFVGFLTSMCEVTFVDIRPLDVSIERLESLAGSVLEMPFADRSLESVSCLHVVEHVGLGRYGDPLDPDGSVKAMAELQRVVAPGGHLLFSGPVGRPRVCFNAHRVHDPHEVLRRFGELELVEFACVDDGGRFSRNAQVRDVSDARYACGMFHFVRPGA